MKLMQKFISKFAKRLLQMRILVVSHLVGHILLQITLGFLDCNWLQRAILTLSFIILEGAVFLNTKLYLFCYTKPLYSCMAIFGAQFLIFSFLQQDVASYSKALFNISKNSLRWTLSHKDNAMHHNHDSDNFQGNYIPDETKTGDFSQDDSNYGFNEFLLTRKSIEAKNSFSIIISVHNELPSVVTTLLYTFLHSPSTLLHEVIIVDDASTVPISHQLKRKLPPEVHRHIKILRQDHPRGPILGRLVGAAIATAANLVFLETSSKPKEGWLQPLLDALNKNYKRVVCPMVFGIDASTWRDGPILGFVKMFNWNLESNWISDHYKAYKGHLLNTQSDLEPVQEVPMLVSGVFATTKQWWIESGQYHLPFVEEDEDKLILSLLIWQCGGEIVLSHASSVGIVAAGERTQRPSMKSREQKFRKASLWFDAYANQVKQELEDAAFDNDLLDMAAFRMKLQCHPFDWYVLKFKLYFEAMNMLDASFHHYQHMQSLGCLSVERLTERIKVSCCLPNENAQLWSFVANATLLRNKHTSKCLNTFFFGSNYTQNTSGYPSQQLQRFYPTLVECNLFNNNVLDTPTQWVYEETQQIATARVLRAAKGTFVSTEKQCLTSALTKTLKNMSVDALDAPPNQVYVTMCSNDIKTPAYNAQVFTSLW